MLSIEKIRIYDKYRGDNDGLTRVGKTVEKNLFRNNDWSLMEEFEQDKKLISDRLVSKDYQERFLIKFRKYCDSETF